MVEAAKNHLKNTSKRSFMLYDDGPCSPPTFQAFANIPLEHTPDPEPTGYEGIPFIWRFGEAWGMLHGYVGVLLET